MTERKDIAERTFDFAAKARQARTVFELNRAFRDLIAPWGFSSWAAVQVSSCNGSIRHPLNRSFGEPNRDWAERYKAQRYVFDDPVALALLTHNQAFFWSDPAVTGSVSPRGRAILREAREFGACKGASAPVRMWDGSLWGVTAGGCDVEETPDVLDGFLAASQYYTGRVLRMFDVSTRPPSSSRRLTERQARFVELVARGYSQTQIASSLHCSVKTVEATLAKARESYGASTTPQLVAEALLSGEVRL